MNDNNFNLLKEKLNKFDPPKNGDDHDYQYDLICTIENGDLVAFVLVTNTWRIRNPYMIILRLNSDDVIALHLDKPKYYKPKKFTGRFTKSELENFINYLNVNKELYGNYWNYIKEGFEISHCKHHKKILDKIPDYTKLLDED